MFGLVALNKLKGIPELEQYYIASRVLALHEALVPSTIYSPLVLVGKARLVENQE